MTIHLYLTNGKQRTIENLPRVTMLEDKPFLILGTRPNLENIPMSEILWFCIEED